MGADDERMNKKQQLNLVYLFVALWGGLIFQGFLGHTASQEELSYSEFERYLQQGWLKYLVVDLPTLPYAYKIRSSSMTLIRPYPMPAKKHLRV